MSHWPQYLLISWWIFTTGTTLAMTAGADAKPQVLSRWQLLWIRFVKTVLLAYFLWCGGFWAPIGFAP